MELFLGYQMDELRLPRPYIIAKQDKIISEELDKVTKHFYGYKLEINLEEIMWAFQMKSHSAEPKASPVCIFVVVCFFTDLSPC